jgi:hydrogenase expression/formation protein HypE
VTCREVGSEGTAVDADRKVRLAHGSGGLLMHELIDTLVVSRLGNPILSELDDSADIADLLGHPLAGGRLAFTTDSYVVQPLFFPGGDIGKLAVSGTVNDLAMKGARPAYLTLGLVAEEGLALADLERVLDSIAATAAAAGVVVAAGDTKVIERGSMGGLIVNTSGIGIIPDGRNVGSRRVAEGDAIIVSGTIGDHETAILVARNELAIDETIESDCAPLGGLVEAVFAACPDVHAMRDPTRGGLATTLVELASRSGVGVTVEERKIPIDRRVSAVCEILGYDPLYMACEGRAVVVVPAGHGEAAVAAMRDHPLGREAAIIGRAGGRAGVCLRTAVGGTRQILMLEGGQLPRIC